MEISENFKCDLCDKSFPREYSLITHLWNAHTENDKIEEDLEVIKVKELETKCYKTFNSGTNSLIQLNSNNLDEDIIEGYDLKAYHANHTHHANHMV